MFWLNEDVYFDGLCFSFYLSLQGAKKLSQMWQHISINVYYVDLKKYILSLFNFDVLEIVGRSN